LFGRTLFAAPPRNWNLEKKFETPKIVILVLVVENQLSIKFGASFFWKGNWKNSNSIFFCLRFVLLTTTKKKFLDLAPKILCIKNVTFFIFALLLFCFYLFRKTLRAPDRHMLDSLLKVGVCHGSTVSVKPGSQSGFEWIEFRFSVIEITSLGLKKIATNWNAFKSWPQIILITKYLELESHF